MRFIQAALAGAWIIEPERIEDARGFFARTFDQAEFQERGLNAEGVQCSISYNRKKGTLRGMHFQIAPYEEVKLVRCTLGAIYDVIVDLRPDSPTFKQWVAVELSAGNRKTLYIPQGLAHGFLTLKDDTEVFYQMSEFYHPESARGVRWNDPAFKIEWALPDPILSEKDQSYPDFQMVRT